MWIHKSMQLPELCFQFMAVDADVRVKDLACLSLKQPGKDGDSTLSGDCH